MRVHHQRYRPSRGPFQGEHPEGEASSRNTSDNAVALIADDEVDKYRVVRVADEIVVDLMADACGVTYAEAVAEGIDRRRLGDVEIPIAKKEVLLRMKDTLRDVTGAMPGSCAFG